MKKVSFIMPAYNAGKTIKRSLSSLVASTYTNLEIIVLNDGSKDDTAKAIDSIKDKRIIHVDKENTGPGDTRNRGLDMATGDYIMFLDADDYIEKDGIEKLVNFMEKNDCDLVISDYFLESTNTIEMRMPTDKDVTTLKESPEIITKINLAPWNKIYKKELFKNTDNRFAKGLKYEDAPVVIQALRDAKKIGFLHECLFHYVIEPGGETFTRNKRLLEIIDICKIIEQKLEGYDYIDRTSLIVKMLSYYLKNAKYIKDRNLQEELIDAIYAHLDELDPHWRRCEYLKEYKLLKKIALTHKNLLKLSCKMKK